LDEAVEMLKAPGSEAARAETFIGLLLAAAARGAACEELLEILDAAWARIEPALTANSVLPLFNAFRDCLAGDPRWPPRFRPFLGGPDSV
jgi:hypothetical protein